MGGWTRNYYNWLTACYGEGNRTVQSTSVPTSYSEPLMVRDMYGAYHSMFNVTVGGNSLYSNYQGQYSPIIQRRVNHNNTTAQGGMYLHTFLHYDENAEVEQNTYEDYIYTGTNKSGAFTLSAENKTTIYNNETHSYEMSFKITFTNNTTTAQTINEISMFISNANTSTSTGNTLFLIYKEYIEPITLEPSESVVVELKSVVPIFNYTPYPTA